MLENEYQSRILAKLRDRFPGCFIMKNDPGYIQGIPDILVLFNTRWAALEVKKSATARTRPNQAWYVGMLNEMSFASFIYPENEEEVFDALQQALRPQRSSRVSQSQ